MGLIATNVQTRVIPKVFWKPLHIRKYVHVGFVHSFLRCMIASSINLIKGGSQIDREIYVYFIQAHFSCLLSHCISFPFHVVSWLFLEVVWMLYHFVSLSMLQCTYYEVKFTVMTCCWCKRWAIRLSRAGGLSSLLSHWYAWVILFSNENSPGGKECAWFKVTTKSKTTIKVLHSTSAL